MRPFLLRLAAFAALQFAVFGALRSVPEPPQASTANAPGHVGDERLAVYLRDWLYPYWLVSPGTLDRVAAAAPDSRILEVAAEAFLNGPDDYLAALIDKAELLKSSPGKRMIFVGGSGLAFGLDSELIAARYGYTPVNLGLHIHLGPEFLLRLTEEHVRPGDVVVLCFEYDGMMADFRTKPDRREQILRLSDDFGRYLGPVEGESDTLAARLIEAKEYADDEALADLAAEIRRSAGAAGVTGARVVSACLAGRESAFDEAFAARREALVRALRRSNAFRNRDIYQRSCFNAHGDLTGHRLREPDEAALKTRAKVRFPERIPSELHELIVANVRRLNEFADRCESRGAGAVFCYAPLQDCPSARPFARKYDEIVRRELTVPSLCPIDEMIYGTELFFDSPNHLSWDGTCRRMASLATGLDRHVPPVIATSPERQVAERDRALRGRTVVAEAPATRTHIR